MKQLMNWMNGHIKGSGLILGTIGFLLHLVYEMRVAIHNHEPFDWYYMIGQSSLVFVGAAVAGWWVDLVFTQQEKESGNLD